MIFLFIVIVIFLTLAAGFALYLLKWDQGEREPIGALWKAFGLGVVGILIAGGLEQFVLKGDPSMTHMSMGGLAIVCLAIGVIEELAKSVPLIFLLYHKRFFNEHTDGVIYFALAGLGFGLPENILYTLQKGTGTGIGRIILTPLFHSATTAIIGYAMARVKIDHFPKSYLVKAIIAAIVLHGLYDFGIFSKNSWLGLLSVAVTVALTVNLFVLFMRAKHLDEQQGLSVVGNNSFCRTCGCQNSKRNLYCVKCGNRA